ncbi:YihY/virulence factor BrkB family protein [Actinomyces sp. S4-C9]|uniref:YihY/virulence factor BrkB family protein n=1 Tax=Actinomyces sp. S4-C9 TaxID=1219581 RepID=UPI001E51047C|nr:YihY/virulence factor BrkB family protein [Actinomyces sp. S4-C9]
MAPRAPDAPNLYGPTFQEVKEADGILAKVTGLMDWYNHSRIGRGMRRYTLKRGNLLAGGVSYTSLFSIAAALTVGWTIFMYFLGGNDQLREAVLHALESAMPGLIDTGDGTGMIDPDSLIQTNVWSVTGIVGLLVLVFSASKTMDALKMSLWSMFGIVRLPNSAVAIKIRDLFGFAVLGIGVLATAALGIMMNTVGSWFIDLLSIEGVAGRILLNIATLLAAFVVDTLLVIALVRVTAGVRVPSRDLWIGAAVAGVGSAILRYLGTSAVGSVADNPLLAASAALATLMLWVNLIVRLLLMVAAWIANPFYAEFPQDQKYVHGDSTPNYVTMTEPDTLDWPHNPLTGDIAFDPRENPESYETVLEDEVWHSPRAKWLRVRIESAEAKAQKYRDELLAMGQRQQVGEK